MTKTDTRPRVRRLAAAVAAVGAMVLASGVALLVTAPGASAATHPVNICHATSSDSNPYVFITVDNDSAKLQGHLQHRNDPNKRWKSDGTFGGVAHVKNEPKPDLIGDYLNDNDEEVVMDGVVDNARCNGDTEVEPPEELTTASVSFVDPSCANDNTASYSTEGEHVTFELDGTVAPGESVTVTATVDDGFVFEGDQQTEEFEHTFAAAEDPCDAVSPPTETPVATPTVVSAGLLDGPIVGAASDLRTEQGIALIASGLVLLIAAGGLARPRRVRR